MKKENKEMLKTIISNQELIMKALNIAIPVKEIIKEQPKKVEAVKKVVAKKVTVKVPAKKTGKK
jgi:hypothetical protein